MANTCTHLRLVCGARSQRGPLALSFSPRLLSSFSWSLGSLAVLFHPARNVPPDRREERGFLGGTHKGWASGALSQQGPASSIAKTPAKDVGAGSLPVCLIKETSAPGGKTHLLGFCCSNNLVCPCVAISRTDLRRVCGARSQRGPPALHFSLKQVLRFS